MNWRSRIGALESLLLPLVEVGEDALSALPARWRPRARPVATARAEAALRGVFPAGETAVAVRLAPEDTFIARTTIRTADPVEARRAAALQLSRHAPADPAGLVWGLVAPGSAEETWGIAFARRGDLAAILAAAERAGRLVEAFVAPVAGAEAVIRDEGQLRRRVRSALGLAFAALACLAAAALFASVLASRMEAAADAAGVERRTVMAAAQAAQTRLTSLEAAPAEETGLSPSAAIDVLNAVAATRPEGWALGEITLEDGRLTLVANVDNSAIAQGARYIERLREAGEFGPAALEMVREGETTSQLRLRLMLPADAP